MEKLEKLDEIDKAHVWVSVPHYYIQIVQSTEQWQTEYTFVHLDNLGWVVNKTL
jgi:hypothetical protein